MSTFTMSYIICNCIAFLEHILQGAQQPVLQLPPKPQNIEVIYELTSFLIRSLLVYKKWEEARQRTDQTVLVFKAHLEELEHHLPSFSNEHLAHFFLAKLRPELKTKILSTGIVPKSREEIFAQAIMQEKTLKRTRHGSGGASNSKSKQSNSKGGQNLKDRKDQPLENRISKPKDSKSMYFKVLGHTRC